MSSRYPHLFFAFSVPHVAWQIADAPWVDERGNEEGWTCGWTHRQVDERERWVTGRDCINRPVDRTEWRNARLAEVDVLQPSFSADKPSQPGARVPYLCGGPLLPAISTTRVGGAVGLPRLVSSAWKRPPVAQLCWRRILTGAQALWASRTVWHTTQGQRAQRRLPDV